MLIKTLGNFGQKKSKEGLKKQLRLQASSALLLGALSIGLSLKLDLSDFGAGFLAGIALAMFAGAIYFLNVTRSAQAFNQYYITFYDERNRHIRGLSMQLTTLLTAVLNLILVILYAFWKIELPYIILLLTMFYTMLLGQVIITFLLNKFI